MGSGADIGNGLEDHAGDVEMGRVFHGAFDHGVDGDLFDLGDVSESDWLAQQSQYISTSWSTQGTVLVVWTGAVPRTQTGRFLRSLIAGGIVDVCEGHQVGCEGGFIGLFETGKSERSWSEEARGGVRWRRRLMGMERAAVVFGRTKFVSLKEPISIK